MRNIASFFSCVEINDHKGDRATGNLVYTANHGILKRARGLTLWGCIMNFGPILVIQICAILFAVFNVAMALYDNRKNISFIWTIWKRFRFCILFEITGIIALIYFSYAVLITLSLRSSDTAGQISSSKPVAIFSLLPFSAPLRPIMSLSEVFPQFFFSPFWFRCRSWQDSKKTSFEEAFTHGAR